MLTNVLCLLVSCLILSQEQMSHNLTEKALQLELYFLNEYNRKMSNVYYEKKKADWKYELDILINDTEQSMIKTSIDAANFAKRVYEKHIKGLHFSVYTDASVKRHLQRFFSIIGTAALGESELRELKEAVSRMRKTYNKAKLCPYNDTCNEKYGAESLDSEVEAVMATSTDYNELLYIWSSWRNVSGAKIRSDYKIYVNLSNEAAHLLEYNDYGEMWRSYYEDPDFEKNMESLWERVCPLYEELHVYALKKLKERYPEKLERFGGLIPAHILGSMWAENWQNLFDLLKPYPHASPIHITTKQLIQQNYNVKKMFESAEGFYTSLGLDSISDSYDTSEGAVIQKPSDREIDCHASFWGLSSDEYRIKMCTRVNEKDFVTIYREMGHAQYFQQYKDLSFNFRDGANPGFMDAFGEAIALSAFTPRHLQKIQLLQDYAESDESNINYLLFMALQKVAFLPLSYIVDKWRWDVFSRVVSEKDWNSHWWYYRRTIQKIAPPVNRSENDFDPGAIYDISADSQYISYFFAHILEFQLYRALCIEAGEYDPNDLNKESLHQCDFYQSKKVGENIRSGMKLGAMRHWSYVLNATTGERALSADALLEYFAPLYEYLQKENGRKNPGAEENKLVFPTILSYSLITVASVVVSLTVYLINCCI